MKIMIPTRIILGKKKKKSFPINANAFANEHHRVKHNAKMIFYDYINSLELYDKNKGVLQTPIRMHFEYYTETKPNFDEDNVGYALNKFLADALVHAKLIKDDNFRLVKFPSFKYMGVDKNRYFEQDFLRGRCDVWVEEL